MRVSSVILLLLISAVATGQEVNQVPDLAVKLAAVGSIAILPIAPCPAALDCSDVENRLTASLFELRAKSAWKPSVVLPQKVKQQLFISGQKGVPTGDEELSRLATALNVDALLIPTVPYLGSRHEERTLITAEGNAPEARVELEIFLVSSEPHIVFHGENQGQATTWSQPAGYVGGLLKRLLVKIFPKK